MLAVSDLGGNGVVGCEQITELGPLREVVTAIKQQPRPSRWLSGSLHRIPMALVDEDERISDLFHPRTSRDSPNRRLILLPMSQRPVRPCQGDDGVSGVVRVRGIDRRRHTAVVDDAAAPATGSIDEPWPRRERDRVLLPMDQVSGADVAPMDRFVHRRHRVVLKEDVVAAVNLAQAIRIVQPALRRTDVQARKAGISHRAKGYCPSKLR